MNAPLRQFVSPYARRLARERGVPLDGLKGSGPSGRIVAFDILSLTQTAVAEQDSAPSPPPVTTTVAAPVATVSAIAAQVDFGKMQTLMAEFAGAQLALSVDALIIRAASRAVMQIDVNAGINWEAGIGTERRLIRIADAANLSMGALQSRLDGARTDAVDPGNPAFLSIRRIGKAGIRAVSMPLLPGHAMRLVVSMISVHMAECMLCFDAGSLSEDDAAAFLVTLRDDLETPLRLLA